MILYDQGNSDALQLATIDPATGQLTKLTSVSLSAGIAENAWYRVQMSISYDRIDPDGFQVSARVLRRSKPTDPNSAPAGSVGPPLVFKGSLSATGLESEGEVGIAASAFSTNVNSSVTNWGMGCAD